LKLASTSEIVAGKGWGVRARDEEYQVRLRTRTGTALTLACLLAASALAQGPGNNGRPASEAPLHLNTAENDTGTDSFDTDLYDFEDYYGDDDGAYADDDYDYSEDWRPQTDLDALDAAHEAYAARSDLQLERPEWDAPPLEPPKPPPGWLVTLSEFLGLFAPLFQILFYLIIAAVVLGFLYFVFGEALRVRFGGSGKGKADEGDDIMVDLRPDAAMARSLLEEADALARAGKFAEAVHLLLFRSIEDIQTRLEGGVPKSLTAREIGGLSNLPERARRGLGPIIGIVERSFFGGRDVDSAGWQEARASYEDFAFGEGW